MSAKMIDADASTVAYREYDYHMPDGTQAIVAVSLGNLGQSGAAATFAHENGALAHGYIAVVGRHIALSRPIHWMQTSSGLKVGGAQGDLEVSEEQRSLLLLVLRVFFREVRDVAPGLGEP